MKDTEKTRRARKKLEIRIATIKDVPAIAALVERAYTKLSGYSRAMIRAQINNYPDGQFVAVYNGEIVGYCASIRVDERIALAPHNWDEITSNGFGSRHDPTGDWLYGFEMSVDPKSRGVRLGQRLYDARKALVEHLDLKGIALGGRMPGYARQRRRLEGPEDYVAGVREGKIKDNVLGFQLRNGFEPIGILKNYLPEDTESAGYAAHLVWRNPYVDPSEPARFELRRDVESVRVATCQLQTRAVADFEEFLTGVEYFVKVASDYRCDFIVFPEMFTLQLLAFEPGKLTPPEAIERLTSHTPRITSELSRMALRYNINIMGGSHPTRTDDGDIQNVAIACLRDGAVHFQEKLHPTPNERFWWNIKGGDNIEAIQTDCGPVGVLICYDVEFPELARRLADEGARIIFVPFCTDSRQGYLRVRYCSQARAIENQCYVVLSGNVGNLPNVENMDIQYAKSCILTPCDFPFARDGIAAEATENVETLTISDLNLADLTWARAEGTVQNLSDRRFDLYRITWNPQPPADRPLPSPPRGGTESPGGG